MDDGVVVDIGGIEFMLLFDEVIEELEVPVPNCAHSRTPVVEGHELVDEAGVVLVELDDFGGLLFL